MKKLISPLLILFIFFGVLLIISGCNLKKGSKEDQSAKNPFSLEDKNETFESPFPNTEEGKQLKAHINTMVAQGENAEENYQDSLNRLRKDPGMVDVICDVYKKTPEANYNLRILLTETLKEIHSDNSLKPLFNIANAPIPKDKLPDHVVYITIEQELVIRSIALEGIGYLASEGNKDAEIILEGFINNSDVTIKQMAIRGYLGAQGADVDKRRKILKKKLPKQMHWMLSTKLTGIESVPHPDLPEKFNLDDLKNTHNSKPPKGDNYE